MATSTVSNWHHDGHLTSLYIKRGKVSIRTYVRSYVRNGGRGQLSSELRHNENDVIMERGLREP